MDNENNINEKLNNSEKIENIFIEKDYLEESDEVIYVDLGDEDTTLPFSFFPKSIKDKIIKESLLLLLINIICIGLLIMAGFYIEIFIFLITIDAILGYNIAVLYLSTKSNDFICYNGYISNIETHGFIKNDKTYDITILSTDETKILTVLGFTSPNNKSFNIGDPITIYIDSSEPVKLGENGPYIEHYIDAVFAIVDKPIYDGTNNDVEITAAEYLTDDEDEKSEVETITSEQFFKE